MSGQPRTIERVLATVRYGPVELERLRQAFAPAEFRHCAPDDEAGIADALRTADVAVIAGDLDDRHLAAPRLAWVHCDHAGLTRSARPEVFARGLVVTGAAGRSAAALAQHGFYFALALTYDARGLIAAQDRQDWGIPGYESRLGLTGKTLGVVGLGHTGRAMAELGRAFGMRVLGHTRSVIEPPPGVDRLSCADRGDRLEPLLDEADVLMLAAPLTDASHHLIGAAELDRMKDSAYLINLGRGGLIDSDALLTALREGRIGGAGLDVFETEPLPADSPLWSAPNLLITPHATPALPDRTQRALDIVLANIGRFRRGEPLQNALTERDVYTRDR
ncbi:D-2-hydroxyacid dehydrogenase [Microlunatus speluncae]|uniref:D-2-hydroxyacid dehydrogenase n=1 Tax=Microlunatus speluncae TaxID=2594267 RepID=UPI001266843E|nr:D-2-hydroxyacid dehydrogenase [Microlunatus speluncae]